MHKIMLPTGPRLVVPERTPIGLLAAMQAGAVTLPDDQSAQFQPHWQSADGVAVIDVSGIIYPGTVHIGGLVTGTNWLTRTVAAALAAASDSASSPSALKSSAPSECSLTRSAIVARRHGGVRSTAVPWYSSWVRPCTC